MGVLFLRREEKAKKGVIEEEWTRIEGKGGKMISYLDVLRDREAVFESAKASLEEPFARFLEEAGIPAGDYPYNLRLLELALMAKGRKLEAWLVLKDERGQVLDFPLALPGEPLEELLLLRAEVE